MIKSRDLFYYCTCCVISGCKTRNITVGIIVGDRISTVFIDDYLVNTVSGVDDLALTLCLLMRV